MRKIYFLATVICLALLGCTPKSPPSISPTAFPTRLNPVPTPFMTIDPSQNQVIATDPETDQLCGILFRGYTLFYDVPAGLWTNTTCRKDVKLTSTKAFGVDFHFLYGSGGGWSSGHPQDCNAWNLTPGCWIRFSPVGTEGVYFTIVDAKPQ